MPDRVITAEAIISAKDNTGDVFARIGRKVADIGKGAKASVEVDKMAKSLTALQAQMKAIDKFTVTSRGMHEASLSYKKAQQDARQLGQAIKTAEKPTREMEAAFRRAQRSSDEMAASFKKQGIAVREAKAGLEAFGIPVGKIAGEQARLRGAIDSTTRSIEHQIVADHKAAIAHARAEKAAEKRAHAIAHHGFTNFAMGAAAGVVGVHGVLRTAEAGWEAGSERQHVVAGMRNAGIPQEEINRAQNLATSVSRQAPGMSISQILELHKEARSAVQHPEEVFELMPDLAKAASVLKGMGSDGNIADLVKAGESLGLMNDPKRFHRFLEGQVKAMQVMGKTISTEQVFEAAKYSKSAGATLSDDFLNMTMPSLIQEMHGSSAGDALSALTKRWRGGLAHQHMAVSRLNQMGLLEDPSQIKRSKSGEILGYAGKLKGDSLLGADPDRFFHDIFKPAAEKAGFKTLADQIKVLNETLPSTAANLGRIFLQQEDTLKQHRANNESALGMDDSIANQNATWSGAVASFKAALEDFGAAVTGPALPAVSKGLSWLAGEFRDLSSWAEKHPNVAVTGGALGTAGALSGAGYLSYQFMTAGTSLQTAAVMLQEAAVAQGANPLKKLIPIAPLAPTLAETVSVGAIGLAAGAGLAATIGGAAYLVKQSNAAQRPGGGGMWAAATSATRVKDQERLRDMQDEYADLDHAYQLSQIRSKDGKAFGYINQSASDRRLDLQNQISQLRESLRQGEKLPAMVGGSFSGFSASPLQPIGEGGRLPTMSQIPSMAAQPTGPIDITGRVQAETDVSLSANFQFSGLPDGVSLTKTNQTVVSKPSMGPTMPHAASPLGQGGTGHA